MAGWISSKLKVAEEFLHQASRNQSLDPRFRWGWSFSGADSSVDAVFVSCLNGIGPDRSAGGGIPGQG